MLEAVLNVRNYTCPVIATSVQLLAVVPAALTVAPPMLHSLMVLAPRDNCGH